ncbi:LysR family transcriptional regulator [Methylocapsa sp. S129]|uniref:LysR family transcriptional regulator n=1 Tax=Methylocapsa sp. S129 TaxID=1641869 RepID=UPI00131D9A24|nr:LysR family transcriptional regulator [Methylocapsa sp. S129]
MAFTSVSQPLRYFFEVAKSGSFRQAAERINIAASALNRQITLLEAELKAPLFDRRPGRGKLRLTAAGEILLHRVRLSMNELQVARSAIESLRGLKRGVVALGINDSLSRDFLPNFLADFHKTYPEIDFEITVDNTPALLDRIERDEADVILAYNIPARSSIRTIVAFPLGMCVLMAKSHPLAKKNSLRLSDCVGYPLAMPDDSMILTQILREMLAKAGIDNRAILKTNSFELIRDIVASGMAISIQTHFLLSEDPNRRDVRSIPLRDSYRVPHALACCVRAGRDPPIAAAVFVEALKAALTLQGKSGDSINDDIAE